jgi:hypothetical protein
MAAMLHPPNHRSALWLLLIVATYVGIASLYAIAVPAWQAPDEPAHYNYIHELATTGRLPLLQMGDYDQAYLDRLTSQRFPPELSIAPLRYEAHQPPLYYVLAAAVFRLTRGELLPLRLLSVALGAIFVVLVYAIARMVCPQRPLLWPGAAAFVAFLPMHVAMSAAVNNDALAEVVLAAILLLSLYYVRSALGDGSPPRWQLVAALGVALGLALITKVSAYVGIPVALAALWIGHTQGGPAALGLGLQRSILGPNRWALLRDVALMGGAALLIAVPWYARNATVYGHMDILARRWHDTVVVGQLRTEELLAQVGLPGVLERFLVWSFASFWGVFGWMGVWMEGRVYSLLLAFSLAAGIGLMALVARWPLRRASTPVSNGPGTASNLLSGPAPSQRPDALQVALSPQQRFQRWALFLLALSALSTLGVYLSYNLVFVQTQARYLFPALPFMALAAAAGWLEALRPATARWAGAGLLAASGVALLWGVVQDGINRWSVAILAGGGLLLLAWHFLGSRQPTALAARLTNLLYALPFAGMAGLSAYALLAYILPQLG